MQSSAQDLLSPIHGVSLDQYVDICFEILNSGISNESDIYGYVERRGLSSEVWSSVQAGWLDRMHSNESIRSLYGKIYSEHTQQPKPFTGGSGRSPKT